MSLQARLVVIGGDVKTSEIKLRLPCTIGRGRGSAIVLAHPLVSRQHCEVFEADGRLMVRDLGSLNGTFVNNQRIGDTAPLPAGELLTVGTVTFRAVYDPSEEHAPAEQDSVTKAPADTLFAGQSVPSGTGTVPFPMPAEHDTVRPAKEKNPASASSQDALPPAAQIPAAVPGSLSPSDVPLPKPKGSPPANSGDEEPENGSSDDDLQDFLKSLGNK